ncbi:hypothetical protein EP47_04840 [Legionella norrlandica]|uniref:Basal-body rod modification protein FlgD n=1 Tax=Legionella norrlandica TaxID=1498499 RepID=A0A0A2SSG0_9GAMM|nr:FlgD immunoglobulin-like domain containing protein [Legionella norrlandica]KGP63692.1 hypothetical protein EP47_04840 [Legionella norrlandica]
MINTNTTLTNQTNALSPNINTNQLSKDSFLKLLLTQMKMQNPLNPFDASTMMQQMAQLTGLSASEEMVKSVDQLKVNLGTSQVLEAAQVVGKDIQVLSDRLQLQDNKVAQGSVIVPTGVEEIELTIQDSSGKPIKTIKLNAPSEGVLDFTWDGLDEKSNPVSAGFYKIEAKSLVGGQYVKLNTATTVRVNSVAFDKANGSVILNVDGLGGIPMGDVVKIL